MGARVLLLLGVFFYTTHFTTSAKVRSWTTAAMTGLAPHGAKLVAEMGEKIYVVADSRYGMQILSCLSCLLQEYMCTCL